jgi:XapX domain-containing protein
LLGRSTTRAAAGDCSIGFESKCASERNAWRGVFMKLYLTSLGAGLLVGVIYASLGVRSPAPPVIALVGLLGILMGEQLPALARGYLQRTPAVHAWLHQIRPHMFGHLPAASASQIAPLAQQDNKPTRQ